MPSPLPCHGSLPCTRHAASKPLPAGRGMMAKSPPSHSPDMAKGWPKSTPQHGKKMAKSGGALCNPFAMWVPFAIPLPCWGVLFAIPLPCCGCSLPFLCGGASLPGFRHAPRGREMARSTGTSMAGTLREAPRNGKVSPKMAKGWQRAPPHHGKGWQAAPLFVILLPCRGVLFAIPLPCWRCSLPSLCHAGGASPHALRSYEFTVSVGGWNMAQHGRAGKRDGQEQPRQHGARGWQKTRTSSMAKGWRDSLPSLCHVGACSLPSLLGLLALRPGPLFATCRPGRRRLGLEGDAGREHPPPAWQPQHGKGMAKAPPIMTK